MCKILKSEPVEREPVEREPVEREFIEPGREPTRPKLTLLEKQSESIAKRTYIELSLVYARIVKT